MSFGLVFIAMLTIVAAMAVGVLFGREPIRGSCGGLGQVGIEGGCELCGGSVDRCVELNQSIDADPPIDADRSRPAVGHVDYVDASSAPRD